MYIASHKALNLISLDCIDPISKKNQNAFVLAQMCSLNLRLDLMYGPVESQNMNHQQ